MVDQFQCLVHVHVNAQSKDYYETGFVHGKIVAPNGTSVSGESAINGAGFVDQ
jgi:hypothetical protein